MRRRFLIVLAAAASMGVLGPADAQTGPGGAFGAATGETWFSNRGTITFPSRGLRTEGTYSSSTVTGGRFSGSIAHDVVTGVWLQDFSEQRCATPFLDVNYYWGRFRIAFEGGRFTGRWAHCDAPLEGGLPWNGSDGRTRFPDEPQWVYWDTIVIEAAAEQPGQGCRVEKTRTQDNLMQVDYVCTHAAGRTGKASARLELSFKRPAAWVPGRALTASGTLKVTGTPAPAPVGSCEVGVEGSGSSPIFTPLTVANGAREARARGSAAVPGPPACGPDDVCPRMVLVCSINGAQPLVMRRVYVWVT